MCCKRVNFSWTFFIYVAFVNEKYRGIIIICDLSSADMMLAFASPSCCSVHTSSTCHTLLRELEVLHFFLSWFCLLWGKLPFVLFLLFHWGIWVFNYWGNVLFTEGTLLIILDVPNFHKFMCFEVEWMLLLDWRAGFCYSGWVAMAEAWFLLKEFRCWNIKS